LATHFLFTTSRTKSTRICTGNENAISKNNNLLTIAEKDRRMKELSGENKNPSVPFNRRRYIDI